MLNIGKILSNRLLRPRKTVSGDSVDAWYLSGGINAEDCKAAYLAKGAISKANSYVNLANPGTNDLSSSNEPEWNSTNGWVFGGTKQYLSTGNIISTENSTYIFRYSDLNLAIDGYSGWFGAMDYGVEPYHDVELMLGTFLSENSESTFDYFQWNMNYYNETYSSARCVLKYIEPSGVLGLNKNGIYFNGTLVSPIEHAPLSFSWNYALWLGNGNFLDWEQDPQAGNIQCAAFYKRTLTATEMASLSSAIALL